MRKLLPYEQVIEERKDDMPLPDGDMAWHEMEKLLDEEEDDKIIVPPPRLTGCAIWLLPLLLLIGVSVWYFVKKDSSPKVVSDKSKTDSLVTHTSNNLQNAPINTDSKKGGQSLLKDSVVLVNSNTLIKNEAISMEDKKIPPERQTKEAKESEKNNNTIESQIINVNKDEGISFSDVVVTNHKKSRISAITTSANSSSKKLSKEPKSTQNRAKKTNDKNNKNELNRVVDNFPISYNESSGKKENNKKKKQLKHSIYADNEETFFLISQVVDTKNLFSNNEDATKKIVIKVKDIVAANTENSIASTKKRTPPSYYFGASLGTQQQIPINGASSNSFNYYGRENIIAEYIPSPIVRLYKKDKWFVQAEFKYGAPQYNKEFNFVNNVKSDTGFGTNNTTTSTNFILKKSFYHQLPLSFHYNLSPNLSIGAGVVINKFFGAIAEKTVKQRSFFGGTDSTLFKGIIGKKDVPDSNFTKVSYQTILESQYRWKRYMLGLKYTIGLTPYISYTDSQTGIKNTKYHQNFNVFFRYELWNTKKRNKERKLIK